MTAMFEQVAVNSYVMDAKFEPCGRKVMRHDRDFGFWVRKTVFLSSIGLGLPPFLSPRRKSKTTFQKILLRN